MASAVRALSIEELNKLTRHARSRTVGEDYNKQIRVLQQLWSDLLATVHDPSVSERHMTAACNAVCFVMRSCSRSACDEVRIFSLSSTSWIQTFDAARCAFATGKNKPALQVLDTLAYLAESHPEKEVMSACVSTVAIEMVEIVFNQRPKKSLKEACIVLYFFLKKLSDFMSFSDVLEQAFQQTKPNFARLCHGHGIDQCDIGLQSNPHWFAFVLALLMVIRVAESKSATLKLLCLLSSLSLPGHVTDLASLINEAIGRYSAVNDTALKDVSREVLPSILTNSEQYHRFLSEQTDRGALSDSTVQVALALLAFGRTQSFVQEEGQLTIGHNYVYHIDESRTAKPGQQNSLQISGPDIFWFP